MNKNTAAQYLPLVQALVAGKTLQVFNLHYNRWQDIVEPTFTSDPGRYRIKPEPRTAHQIYMDAAYPEFAPHNTTATDRRVQGFIAVIAAVKSGEL